MSVGKKEKINVLSLFDGISCGQIALEKVGIEVENYFASEIDKYAMQITMANYPNTKQLGDVRNVTAKNLPNIDLLIGGSPCQGFSFAGAGLNFEDERSKLFFEFVRLKNELKPKYFLLENVKMKQEFQDIISEQLGVKPIMINSSLVSAQNRERLYWTNIPVIGQPNDKGILLKDIIEDGECLKDKSQTILATLYKENAKSMIKRNKQGLLILKNIYPKKGQNGNVYSIFGKCKTLSAGVGIKGNGIGSSNAPKIESINSDGWRKLSPLECERLQTVPDNEIICIFALCLDQVKNYVNAVEQNPKLLKLALSAEKEKLNEFVKLANQNTKQSNQQTKCIVPPGADMMTQRQINQYTKINQKENNTTANNAENIVMCKSQNQEADSALPNAFINITEGKIIHFGTEELHRNGSHSTIHLNGKKPLVMFGNEIMELVKNVGVGMKKNGDMNFTSTTLSALSISSLEQMLATYYLFAKNAITGYIPNITNQKSLSVQFQINDGYTSIVSDTQRYKALGNGWTVDVISFIFSFLRGENFLNSFSQESSIKAQM